jgi:hypothetical protein
MGDMSGYDKSTDTRRDNRSIDRFSNPMGYETPRIRDVSLYLDTG